MFHVPIWERAKKIFCPADNLDGVADQYALDLAGKTPSELPEAFSQVLRIFLLETTKRHDLAAYQNVYHVANFPWNLKTLPTRCDAPWNIIIFG